RGASTDVRRPQRLPVRAGPVLPERLHSNRATTGRADRNRSIDLHYPPDRSRIRAGRKLVRSSVSLGRTARRRMDSCLMNSNGPIREVTARLRAAGLRPTRQRIALARLLFGEGDRHVTAEQLHAEALGADARVSLATVYNTLHQFVDAGLLRELTAESGRSWFDTNTGT